jgi:hypothetical protein
MEPLGTTKRATLLGIAIALFIIILPVLFLYVSGFRLSNTRQGLVETGGIYIHRKNIDGVATISGGSLATPFGSTDALNQGLAPGMYTVNFARENFSSWQKHVPVTPRVVTEVHPIQVPLEPVFTPIPQKILDGKNRLISNAEYTATQKLFLPQPTEKVAASAATNPSLPQSEKINERIRDKTRVFELGTTLYAEWLGNENTPPHYFCDTPTICSLVTRVAENIPLNAAFDFFPDRHDILIIAKKDGIYVTEIDRYGGRNEVRLVSGENLSFVLSGTTLYIKDGLELTSLNLDW